MGHSKVNKYTIKDLKDHAKSLGGECLSVQYKNNKTKYLWQCKKGHQWSANWSNVHNHNQWCPQCVRCTYTIKDLQQHAINKGGLCLSREYTHMGALYEWSCEQGHVWQASWESIQETSNKKGTWCPYCARRSFTLKDLIDYAASHEGICLSLEYTNSNHKYKWKCKHGHQWRASWAQMVSYETWCPKCARPSYELSDLQELAADRGGICLSESYYGSHQKYLWECKVGHQWEATWSSVNTGKTWCAKCVREDWLKKNRKWDEKTLRKEAVKYKTRGQFEQGSHGAYKAAWRMGVLDLLFEDHRNKGYENTPPGSWTKSRVTEIAKKYKTRSEFMKKAGPAYSVAHKNGWLDDVCSHMETSGNLIRRKIYAIVSEDLKRVYVGLSFDPHARYQEHKLRGQQYVKDIINVQHELVILTELLHVDEAATKEKEFIDKYLESGYDVVNKMAAGGLGSTPFKWTKETVAAEAQKYATRSEFQKHAAGAYQITSRSGWTDEIFSKHENNGYSQIRGPKRKWNWESVSKLAKNCETRVDLKRKSPSAYTVARKNGWLDEFFPKNGNDID